MTFFAGRTAGRKSAAPHVAAAAKRGLHFSWPVLPLGLALMVLASCGVKNDLVRPNGQATARGQPDPSKPPGPLGR